MKYAKIELLLCSEDKIWDTVNVNCPLDIVERGDHDEVSSWVLENQIIPTDGIVFIGVYNWGTNSENFEG